MIARLVHLRWIGLMIFIGALLLHPGVPSAPTSERAAEFRRESNGYLALGAAGLATMVLGAVAVSYVRRRAGAIDRVGRKSSEPGA